MARGERPESVSAVGTATTVEEAPSLTVVIYQSMLQSIIEGEVVTRPRFCTTGSERVHRRHTAPGRKG